MTKLDNLDDQHIESNPQLKSHKDNVLESKKTLENLKKSVENKHPELEAIQKKLSLLEQDIDNNIWKKEDIDRQINDIDDTLSDIKNRIILTKNIPSQYKQLSESDIVEQANIGRFEAASTISKNIQEYPGLLWRIMKFLDRTS